MTDDSRRGDHRERPLDPPAPDPVDEEAAEIDARSTEAPEQIEELKEAADNEPARVDPAAPGNFVDDDDAAAVPEPNEPA